MSESQITFSSYGSITIIIYLLKVRHLSIAFVLVFYSFIFIHFFSGDHLVVLNVTVYEVRLYGGSPMHRKFLYFLTLVHHIRDIKDPEHPYSLEDLKVITEDAIEVDDKKSRVRYTSF